MGLALTLIWTYGFTYWILAITFCVAGFYYGIMSVVAGGKKRTPTSRRPPTNVTDALAKLMVGAIGRSITVTDTLLTLFLQLSATGAAEEISLL